METSTKYNRYAARIPKEMGVGGGGGCSLRFNVQRRGGGEVLPNLDPFGQVEKGGSVCKNWTIFIDATNVSSLHPYNSFDLSI